jgi:hypothetical protein
VQLTAVREEGALRTPTPLEVRYHLTQALVAALHQRGELAQAVVERVHLCDELALQLCVSARRRARCTHRLPLRFGCLR